ncbi:MAG: glyoxalase [Cytophagales bacterium CG12_big_fil_rev_8_21_14_0_65_40_12]|nr:MAG: glyoxalase [Cytophagales bacterium CG12_big_fil_rev_8_21_14_0_65_40_12]PIW03746.1 MAG: glyoxalase [Cytophagales bacterium CG17_big_fil_post_rev_8_21_14_2_50_40_13]
MKKLILLLICFSLVACQNPENSNLSSFKVYCEMVANGAKPIALSQPLSVGEADEVQADFEEISAANGLKIYREDNFPETSLFPQGATKEKSVFIVYKEDARLTQYKQLKSDIAEGKIESIALARRMGRLLGYDTKGINTLLSKNTDFRSYASFGIEAQTTHLFYANVEAAANFYANTLGLKNVGDNRFQIGEDVFLQVNPLSEKHPANQAKSTAIAFLTDQLPAWYEYLQSKAVEIKYTYKPKEGGPHDGFVAIDPEGYLLEFEQFKQHPENELFVAALALNPRIETAVEGLSFYGSITWTYHQDMLRQENFYNETLGFQRVADQGWTKIYQTSSSGFIGLVDERRGMENYADEKAVELEWKVKDLSALEAYLSKKDSTYNGLIIGPELYYYRFE